jgi:hypothetical protein
LHSARLGLRPAGRRQSNHAPEPGAAAGRQRLGWHLPPRLGRQRQLPWKTRDASPRVWTVVEQVALAAVWPRCRTVSPQTLAFGCSPMALVSGWAPPPALRKPASHLPVAMRPLSGRAALQTLVFGWKTATTAAAAQLRLARGWLRVALQGRLPRALVAQAADVHRRPEFDCRPALGRLASAPRTGCQTPASGLRHSAQENAWSRRLASGWHPPQMPERAEVRRKSASQHWVEPALEETLRWRRARGPGGRR